MAKLVKSEMKTYKEWNLDSAAIGVAWLDDQVWEVSFYTQSSCCSILFYFFLVSVKH